MWKWSHFWVGFSAIEFIYLFQIGSQIYRRMLDFVFFFSNFHILFLVKFWLSISYGWWSPIWLHHKICNFFYFFIFGGKRFLIVMVVWTFGIWCVMVDGASDFGLWFCGVVWFWTLEILWWWWVLDLVMMVVGFCLDLFHFILTTKDAWWERLILHWWWRILFLLGVV